MLPFVGDLINLLMTIMRSRHSVSSRVSFSKRGEKLSDSNSPRFAAPTALSRCFRGDCPWRGSKHCRTRDEGVDDLSTQTPH